MARFLKTQISFMIVPQKTFAQQDPTPYFCILALRPYLYLQS